MKEEAEKLKAEAAVTIPLRLHMTEELWQMFRTGTADEKQGIVNTLAELAKSQIGWALTKKLAEERKESK